MKIHSIVVDYDDKEGLKGSRYGLIRATTIVTAKLKRVGNCLGRLNNNFLKYKNQKSP